MKFIRRPTAGNETLIEFAEAFPFPSPTAAFIFLKQATILP
jgi:hypothetical protein